LIEEENAVGRGGSRLRHGVDQPSPSEEGWSRGPWPIGAAGDRVRQRAYGDEGWATYLRRGYIALAAGGLKLGPVRHREKPESP